MKRTLIAAAALATFLVVAAPQAALAGCAEFQITGQDLSLEYDPFSPAPIERAFTLRVRRVDGAATAVRFLLADIDSPAGAPRISSGPGGYDIRWNRDTSRQVFVTGAEQPNATNGALVQFGDGPSGDLASETMRFSLPAGQDASSGDYYEALEARFVCYSGDQIVGPSEFQRGAGLAVDLNVPERISTYVGAAGVRRGEIAFGALDPTGGTVTRNLVVTTQSTVPYDIDVAARWGRLQRREGDPYGLNYGMKLSGVTIESGSKLSCTRTPAPAGRAHPFQVELPQAQAANIPAGAYSDVVTLTFTPRAGLSSPSQCTPRL
ncbi:hypothetical protein [Brevundimonas sp. KM4]|uniref:hypothetical protein n=1 Tax=Brevundimonas sp. KM4 TaxID=1628191 RepID=UPI0005F85B64|nr:hypothetical protein [Brevundimonas sp. KM4]KJV40315.1 hypothetical protein VH88_11365 [Brevundimonas sp. KM4]